MQYAKKTFQVQNRFKITQGRLNFVLFILYIHVP